MFQGRNIALKQQKHPQYTHVEPISELFYRRIIELFVWLHLVVYNNVKGGNHV